MGAGGCGGSGRHWAQAGDEVAGPGTGTGDLVRPQASQAQAGRRDLVPVAVAQIPRAAQLDDRLDDLHHQRCSERLVHAVGGRVAAGAGVGGRNRAVYAGRDCLPEPPVGGLQLRPLARNDSNFSPCTSGIR